MSLCALRVGAVTSYPCHLNSLSSVLFLWLPTLFAKPDRTRSSRWWEGSAWRPRQSEEAPTAGGHSSQEKGPCPPSGTDLSEGGTARVLELSPFKPWTSYFRTSATSKLYTLATPLSKILTHGDIARLSHPPTRLSVISGKRFFKSSDTPSLTRYSCLRFLSLRSTTKTSPSQG